MPLRRDEVRDLGHSLALDEVADRDKTLGCDDPSESSASKVRSFSRQADADVEFVGRVVGTIGADAHAARDELHIGAELTHADAVLGSSDAIDGDLPVDAGSRASVLDVDGVAQVVLDEVAQLRDDRKEVGIDTCFRRAG